MTYKIENDPYIDKTTGTLANNFDITDQEMLDAVEFEITSSQIASFEEYPVRGNFDLAHLKAIHLDIFGNLYPWAGELRTVDMAKDDTLFAHAQYIESAANELFLELRREKWLKGLNDSDFITRFVYYYSEVNVLHPFREGNGRVQRAFFTLLAKYCGYHVAWDRMYQDDNISASIAAYNGDYEPLEEILQPLLDWIHEDYFYFVGDGSGWSKVDKSISWPA